MKNLIIIVGSIIGMMISLFGLVAMAFIMSGTIVINEGDFLNVTFDTKNILELSEPTKYPLEDIEIINIPIGTQICFGIKDGSTDPRIEIKEYGFYETSQNNKELTYSSNKKINISKNGMNFEQNSIFVDFYVKDFAPINSLNLNRFGISFGGTNQYQVDALSQCYYANNGYVIDVNKLIQHYNEEVANAKE